MPLREREIDAKSLLRMVEKRRVRTGGKKNGMQGENDFEDGVDGHTEV